MSLLSSASQGRANEKDANLQETLSAMLHEMKRMSNYMEYMVGKNARDRNPAKAKAGNDLKSKVASWSDSKLYANLHKAQSKNWSHLYRVVSNELERRGLLEDDEEWEGDYETHPMLREKEINVRGGDYGGTNNKKSEFFPSSSKNYR